MSLCTIHTVTNQHFQKQNIHNTITELNNHNTQLLQPGSEIFWASGWISVSQEFQECHRYKKE